MCSERLPLSYNGYLYSFRKQQKAYLNRLRQKSGPSASGASLSVLDDTAGTSGREALDPEYDPGFNEIQVHGTHVYCITRFLVLRQDI